jgi:hypothetical protein
MKRRTIASGAVRGRVATWLCTGPVGHLYAGVADWAVLLARWSWARLRGRQQ